MEVTPAYKQTEVGVIPEDWDVALLANEIDRLDAGVSVNSDSENSVSDGYEPSILKTSAVVNGKFFPSEAKKIIPSDVNRAKLSPVRDSIIISRMNTPDLIGECGYVAKNHPYLFLPDRLWMTHTKNGSDICIRWLSYVLSSQPYKARITGLATGTSGSMKNIAKNALLAISIPYPKPEEQRTIAAALSDVDALLDGLDCLIVKKRAIKQATMQQLLTGQTRLPGFGGNWEVKRMGDLGATYGGLVGKKKADFGSGSAKYVPFINVMANVQIDCAAFDTVNVDVTENQNKVAKGDLLFNGSSETPEEVALCSFMSHEVKDLYLNSFCFGFRIKDISMVDGLFFAYYMRSPLGRDLMKSLAQGSTRYNLSKSALLEAQLVLPDKEEQTAIAIILSDMDTEITALESRRIKTCALKQAMMQELLTGRTRLV